jgi:hypothetical protein
VGGEAGEDLVFGFGGSTSAMPKRAARALRFSSSSSTGVASTVVLVTSFAAGVVFGGGTFDCGLAYISQPGVAEGEERTHTEIGTG